MPNKSKKNSSKSDLFWGRFEKSGSIQAYLRFHQARRGEQAKAAVVKKGAKSATKAR